MLVHVIGRLALVLASIGAAAAEEPKFEDTIRQIEQEEEHGYPHSPPR